MENWSKATHIWEGLENFRQLRRDIFHLGVSQITQASVNQFLPSYNFTVSMSSKNKLANLIEQTLNSATFDDPEVQADLVKQRQELGKIEEDLILIRSMDHYDYEFVFKEDKQSLHGFVKILHRTNRNHVALMNWQDTNNPILFLYEIEDGHLRLHVNYGEDGLAIIEQPSELKYKWTHCLQEGFLSVAHAECGSVLMSKMTKHIQLEQGNLAAVEASRRAQEKQPNGKTLLENNIQLLNLHKPELEKLIETR